MKHNTQFIIRASAVSVLAISALGQDTYNPKAEGSEYVGQHRTLTHPRADRLNDAAKASDLIGMTVNNYQSEKLGKVEDLAVDVESGRIVQVILSSGGFIGIGNTLMAVPPGALRRDVAGKVLQLDADKDKLKSAPTFDTSKWAEYSDSEHLSEVYRYYGQEPSYTFVQKDDAALEARRNPDRPGTKDSRPNTDGSSTVTSARATDGTWNNANRPSWHQSLIPASRLSQVQRASKLLGTPVTNLQDEKLGKVENLLVDLPSGRLVAFVVSSGGFLGIGDELSAVPPAALRFTTDRTTLQLDASKEMLSNSPHFQANQWPDFAQPSYASGVYRAYNVEPYFTTNVTTDPDNTAVNARDLGSRTLTPLDQGNSKADINTTAQIRKDIIADQAMSINAQNVKIITNKGQVTLRGRVNTAEEKRLIGDIANNIARVENVDNQLEVKFISTGKE